MALIYQGVVRITGSKKSRGAACVEAALIIPAIILFLGGTIDFGEWFYNYISVTRIVYEAARYGAQIPGVETVTHCPQDTPNCDRPNHGKIRCRAEILLRKRGYIPADETICPYYGSAYTFSSSRTDPTTEVPSELEVQLTIPYTPFFIPFLNKITAKARAPYLYRSS